MRRIEKEQAIALRVQGKSYNEIRKILNISSKGTLSYWFKDFQLPPEAKKRLAHKMWLAKKRGLLQFNKDRTKAVLIENKLAQENGKAEIGTLSRRELLLIGAALYWGEGAKSERDKRNNSIAQLALSNSDPRMISLYMRFVREILAVPEERIRAGIQVHPNLSVDEAKNFWANITKLPLDRFFITYQISSASKLKRPKRFLPYGTISIRVNKRVLFYKMKGYIEGFCQNF
ncbi:MAG: hypothetical protein Q7S48_04515 [bacterium]|nr:hypothetical protein [bacterium]